MKDVPPFARRAIRKNLCDRYGGCCAYCGIYVGMKGTVDHYVPQALGGQNQPHNLRWACLKCNNLKGDMSPKEWEAKKPPRVQHETKYDKRIRLLAGIAQRGESDVNYLAKMVGALLIGLLLFVLGMAQIMKAVRTDEPTHCVQGYTFYGKAQVLDGQGRGIPCESVRTPEGKPRS